MRKFWDILKHIAGFTAIMVGLLLSWSIAYGITEWVYPLFDWHLHAFVKQLVNSALGFVIFGFSMYMISRSFKVRNRQLKFFNPMIIAMEQIAKGNFNIDLSYYQKQNLQEGHPFYHIVNSIKHMAEELGEMEQMRQEFISNVSHEIQSPLTSISGFAQALKNENLTHEEKLHYLEIIETESKRLSKLSDNLLKLTSLESEKTPFEPKNYRLDQQIRRVILSCEPQWTARHIEMDVSLDKVTITADEALVDQVWINLIHNSIKFTPENGTISISLHAEEEKAVVHIADTGIGMSEEVQVRIFERFYKADKSRNRLTGGNGLGLSIVKKILELHHGDIYVKSQVGKGTTFKIMLPLKH